MRIKTAFTSILGIFVRFLMKFWAVMGKRRKLEVRINVLMDGGRRVRSVKINNSLEIESCADENGFYFDFGYFCSFFNKILGCYGKTEKIKI